MQQNTTRGNEDGDFEHLLKADLPVSYVVSMLKSQGKDQKTIDAFVEKYATSRKKVRKMVEKFSTLLRTKYGTQDIPLLIKKGMKHAEKHGFSPAEKNAFIRFVLTGQLNEKGDELEQTDMGKFFGVAPPTMSQMNIKATDQSTLNEIARNYEATRMLFAAAQVSPKDFEMLTAADVDSFDGSKYNKLSYIHPLIVALFARPIHLLEDRMLKTNIGRMVIQHSQPYFISNKNYVIMSQHYNNDAILDTQFAYDIVKDPNSLNYFSNDSPLTNLLKRFQIQIELWKNVLMMRSGHFYSKGEFLLGSNDNITGLYNLLSTYDWAFFDSPDLMHIHDEGAMLKKLLAVFSLRTITSTVEPVFGVFNGGEVKQVSANIPFASHRTTTSQPSIDIRLEQLKKDKSKNVYDLSVEDFIATAQDSFFIENKTLVGRKRSVTSIDKVLFVHVNRRTSTLQTTSGQGYDFKYAGLMPYMPSYKYVFDDKEITIGPTIMFNKKVEYKLVSYIFGNTEELNAMTAINPTKARIYVDGGNDDIIYDPAKNSVKTYYAAAGVADNLMKTNGTVFVYATEDQTKPLTATAPQDALNKLDNHIKALTTMFAPAKTDISTITAADITKVSRNNKTLKFEDVLKNSVYLDTLKEIKEITKKLNLAGSATYDNTITTAKNVLGVLKTTLDNINADPTVAKGALAGGIDTYIDAIKAAILTDAKVAFPFFA